MGYSSLQACVADLERTRQLVRIEQEVDAHLEAACIVRRVYQAGGPAVFFPRVKNCRFPMVGNLFGTMSRARFIFRDTLQTLEYLVKLKVDPLDLLRHPWEYWKTPQMAYHLLPQQVHEAPVLQHHIRVSDLPQLQCWPQDGGPFITLPQVYSEDPAHPGVRHSNLGMYRVQLAGNRYRPDADVGLHYQIHRGIGIHHATAVQRGQRLPVAVHVGGPPALTVSAIMPLPEGMPEIAFAGALGGQRTRVKRLPGGATVLADADFVLIGSIDNDRQLPEGPFGDHLGYYSLAHDFPVMQVDAVYHRANAIWPFTSVGRPPQEDTTFGELIHEITGALIPTVLPGVKAVHAVDAAGVHPLLLAIGRERYVPYQPRTSAKELLTQANAILGQGQLSLAKYLLIIAAEDDDRLPIDNISGFFHHLLSRIDWRRDLHFQTRTTIDTLDYSGTGLNEGSKVVMAAVGEPIRTLSTLLPERMPVGVRRARLCQPGIVAVEVQGSVADLCSQPSSQAWSGFPLWVVVDDCEFASATLNNFLWTTFTRSNPAMDIYGFDSFSEHKHWGCRGPLVIDARIKAHHAPPLQEDPDVLRRVDQLAAPGGPLHGLF